VSESSRKAYYRSEEYQESQRRYAQERHWRKESRATGEVCAKCGKAFDEDERRYRASMYGSPFMVMCEDCAPEWLSSGEGKPIRFLPAIDVYVWECAGCGCEVAFGMSEYQGRLRVYCSDRCRAKFARERQRKQREPHVVTCEVCGQEFTPKRSDARTCSPACRQRAYRKRLHLR
jgi:predicted nucleic acid-binding Zn ribbon protein